MHISAIQKADQKNWVDRWEDLCGFPLKATTLKGLSLQMTRFNSPRTVPGATIFDVQ